MRPFRDPRIGGGFVVPLAAADDFPGWRDHARRLLRAEVPPDRVAWSVPDEAGAIARAALGDIRRLPAPRPDAPQPRVPRAFLALAERAVRHPDTQRFAVLYRLLWRLQARPGLLENVADPDVRRLAELAGASIRDPARWKAEPLAEERNDMPDEPIFPEQRPTSLKAIGEAIQECRRCPIGCNGTRAVMGEGPKDAALMIVGEQPGDVEEQEGRPFVGPAGRLLTARMEDAGIARDRTYVTNAVKHFKFVQRGKRRLHQSPTGREIDICRWWVESERGIVQPQLVLALGASAARGMLGKTVGIAKARGAPMPLEGGGELWVTAHPSYLLRLDGEAKVEQERLFRADLAAVAERLEEAG